MKVLIAVDDPISLRLLQAAISAWGHEVMVANNCADAWQTLRAPDAPKLALLDWTMPGLNGIEVCERLRAQVASEPAYVILLSWRRTTADIVSGLQHGANDYVVKPFDQDELHARFNVGCRVVELQQALAARVRELEEVAAQIQQLRMLLPICCSCKKIRDDQDHWHQLEAYFMDHSEVRFSHDLCPDCLDREISELA